MSMDQFRQLQDNLTATFIGYGQTPETAQDMSAEAIAVIANTLGTGEVSIPVNQLQIKERNRKICQAFNGKNHAELARKFGLSKRQLYNILKAL